MGRSRYTIHEEYYPYFITSSIVDRISLFSDSEIARIILESLTFIQNEFKVKLYAYVIMENHIHMIAEVEELSECIRKFKSYTARQIIDSLTKRNRSILLKRLKSAKKSHKTENEYQVWEEGIHPIQMNTYKKMIDCIEYIHNNPVKAGFVGCAEHWRYSSASSYHGLEGLIPITKFEG